MTSRGNVVASLQKSELQQLDSNITKFQSPSNHLQGRGQVDLTSAANPTPQAADTAATTGSGDLPPDILSGSGDFSSEDGLYSDNQLQLVAESFSFDQLDYWLATGDLDGPLHNF